MTPLVVDASVVVKWFVPEVHTEAARQWLDTAHTFFAPDLLFAEAANTVWKKARRGELTRDQGQRLVADLADVPVEAVACRALMQDAHALASATGRSVYDALYLALAVRLGTRVITADERFATAVAQFRDLRPHVSFVTAAERA